MSDLVYNPAFHVYAIFVVGLGALLMGIDGWGGVARALSKTAVNQEDTSTVAKGAKLVDSDPDGVARVMRAHRNALANIVPFLLITLVWVLMGATPKHVLWVCSAFSAARLFHAIVYIRAIQPWRTLSFVVAQTITLTVGVRVVLAAVHMLGITGLEPPPRGDVGAPAPKASIVEQPSTSKA